MARRLLGFSFIFILVATVSAVAQNWAGILNPARAIDWTQSGIPGGIPTNRTQCGPTLQASSYGSGSSDATSGIQTALNNCAANQFVLLGTGTFRINSYISIPSNVTLRGSGTQSTILSFHGSATDAIAMGAGGSSNSPNVGASLSITNGATAGSTTLTLSSTSGVSVGSYLMISELNNSSFVTITTTNGSCTWCDTYPWNGTRVRGQIVEVTSVNGSSVGISPGLYSAFTLSPLATPFEAQSKYAGLESLQLYANNTGYSEANIGMSMCAYCWVKQVESNYADGNHVAAYYSYRGEIRDSYFSNGFIHHSGSVDTDLTIAGKTSGFLVENNILERLHVSIMFEWGAAGNVISYNYDTGNYDDTGDPSINHVQMMAIDMHGAHPQFNLWEGNVSQKFDADGFWGSSSDSTAFRNWITGTTLIAPYSDGSFTGRKAINWAAGWYPNQSNLGFNLSYIHSRYNLVGNVSGSAEVASVDSLFKAGPTACTGCLVSPSNRNYQGTFYAFSSGYATTGDSTGQCAAPVSSCTSYATTFLHGNYDTPSGLINWDVNYTGSHTLPASFYKSSQPSWWGSLPWPSIGPDVTGGSGPGGHTSLSASNPAQACYNNTAKDSYGVLQFNPATCYGSSGGGNAPAPPTGLAAVVQ
jgi:hypothetical protein